MRPPLVVANTKLICPDGVDALSRYTGAPSAVSPRLACHTRCSDDTFDAVNVVSEVLLLECPSPPPNWSQLIRHPDAMVNIGAIRTKTCARSGPREQRCIMWTPRVESPGYWTQTLPSIPSRGERGTRTEKGEELAALAAQRNAIERDALAVA